MAPPYPVEPVSGSEYAQYSYEAQPAPAQGGPVIGSPMSGAPMVGAPMSGAPMSGGPFGGPTAAVPVTTPPRRGMGTVIFGALAAFLLILAGIMTALYVAKTGQYNDANKTVAARDTTISNQNTKISGLQTDLQKAKDDLDAAKRDLNGSQTLADDLKKQKQVIKNCLNLLGEAADLSDKGDKAGADAKLKEAGPICDEADTYLAS
jgi:hypothetical protein